MAVKTGHEIFRCTWHTILRQPNLFTPGLIHRIRNAYVKFTPWIVVCVRGETIELSSDLIVPVLKPAR